MGQYTYILFGYHVLSDIDLHIPTKNINHVDLTISLSDSIELEILPDEAVFGIEVHDESVIIRLTDAGRIELSKSCIRVYPYIGYDANALNLYLKGSVFGSWLLMMDRFGLHGSAIDIDGKALVIMGKSGAGKSTLARAFLQKGYRLISDDVSLIHHQQTFYIESSYPSQKLWRDVLEHYDLYRNRRSRIAYRDDKFNIDVEEDFHYARTPLGAIVYLDVNGDCLDITHKQLHERLELLLNNLYLGDILEYFDKDTMIFRTMADMAAQIPTFHLSRPVGTMSVNEQAELILNTLSQL